MVVSESTKSILEGRGNAGGIYHHRILFDKYHPGYFGKVGMRYFHRLKNKFYCPILLRNYHIVSKTLGSKRKPTEEWVGREHIKPPKGGFQSGSATPNKTGKGSVGNTKAVKEELPSDTQPSISVTEVIKKTDHVKDEKKRTKKSGNHNKVEIKGTSSTSAA
uniref:60S ribosomal protein L27a-3-like n=1 Tax=Tanacetum cinerariifolium TaxID=118510 RepID=A0A6L2KLT0_TANCI|nr:60S ribosomal protein L27a-3-like [Tanacetum cinerariifolium]